MKIETKYNIGDEVLVNETVLKKMICPICDGEGMVTIKLRKFKCPQCFGGRALITTDRDIKQRTCKISSFNISVTNPDFVRIKYESVTYNKIGVPDTFEFDEVDVMALISPAKK